MNIRKQVKQNSRRALSGNWGKAICIFIIALSIFAIFSLLQKLASLLLNVPDFQDIMSTPQFYLDDVRNITGISMLISGVFVALSMFVNAPLSFGIKQWFFRLAGGQADDVAGAFSFFGGIRLFFKTIWHNLNLMLRLLFWDVLFSVVPVGVCIAARLLLESSASPSGRVYLGGILLFLLGALLFVLAQVFFFVFSNRYFLTAYLMIDDPGLSVMAAFRTSARYMKGGKWDIFVFELSFLPWVLLCVLVLPLLYVVPYFGSASALYAKYYVERGKLHEPEEQTVQFDVNGQHITEEQIN